jgi:pectate lyase
VRFITTRPSLVLTNHLFSTTGGGSATPVTVTTLAALKTALASGGKVVIVSGTITGNEVVKVLSNTSVIGKSGACKSQFPSTPGEANLTGVLVAALVGVGLRVIDVSNVIIRNLKVRGNNPFYWNLP